MKGKIIVIEGTDGSGKRTQAEMLYDKFVSKGILCKIISFPRYDTPTGKIISECYLGRDGKTPWFSDPTKLNPKIASLYYAADRLAAKSEIESIINSGTNLILDRYVESNMAHQGGKLNGNERKRFFEWVENLEYNLNNMPRPDETIFLYVPMKVALELKKGRENSDAHESSLEHLRNAEETYIELSERFGWEKVSCVSNGEIKKQEEIHEEIYKKISL